MPLNISRTRDLLQTFDFSTLFIEELGWLRPASRRARSQECDGLEYRYVHIAELSGVVVLEVTGGDGAIPSAKTRAALHKEIAKLYHENLLVFVDAERTQSLWYWAKRENGKTYPREHLYVKGQPGDLFISKLSAIVFDLSRLDERGNISIVEVANSLQKALDIERVTRKFYTDYASERVAFTELIEGIEDDRQRRWYASVMLNRLMFVYFLQSKGFVNDGEYNYLQRHLAESETKLGENQYYEKFMKLLLFEGFAKPERERTDDAKELLGNIVYLNGGLFLEHQIEKECRESNRAIRIPDVAFQNLYRLFGNYSWNLNDTPGTDDNEINPDVLGYIFEKYINQKEFGAYYTRPEITDYLCEQTIHQAILEKINPSLDASDAASDAKNPIATALGIAPPRRFDSLADLLLHLNAPLCRRLLEEVLPHLALLDPACGSGAFLVAAMKTLINVYSAVTGRIEYLSDLYLTRSLKKLREDHPSLNYFIKRTIITNNLFGVDIMEEACEIAKLRLFLALVASAQSIEHLEPLPNIDFNIMHGSSLPGLLRIDDEDFNKHNAQGSFQFNKAYREVLEEKNRLIRLYRNTATYYKDLQQMRDQINEKKAEANEVLNAMLLDHFSQFGIRYEHAIWDDANKQEGRPRKRSLTIDDICALQPFHWGFEFDEVLTGRGGFDAIITNPPWEVFKPQSKEFFMEHSDLVTKNKMTIKEFEEKRAELLLKSEIRTAWLEYLSKFPHVSAFYRQAAQYKNQISVINGKKAGTDINLYKLFTEQCYNLLRSHGRCGIIVPSGIYSDLGTKQLRDTLFSQCKVETLFGLSNEKYIFENVHHSVRFAIIVFEKGETTDKFEAAFRINPREAIAPDKLRDFLRAHEQHVFVPMELIRRLSPSSLSVMEFKNEVDVFIAEKMLRYSLLGDRTSGMWNLSLTNEFHMTNDSKLFRRFPSPGCLPLYEGKMIHQFSHTLSQPRYWIAEQEGRAGLLGRIPDNGQVLDYQDYRLALRRVARNTDERSMIATILPRNVFASESFHLSSGQSLRRGELLVLTSILNSFVLDYCLRQRIAANISMFYVYQLPVPHLTQKDAVFATIVERASRLICTSSEFDDLAREVGLGSCSNGVTNPGERARLRAELDGIVAHLYGLTEEEFVHILDTFPLVAEPIKVATQNAYRDVQRGLIK